MESTPFTEDMEALARNGVESVSALVEQILAHARQLQASDIHLDPSPKGLLIRARLDGVLQTIGNIPESLRENVVARCRDRGWTRSDALPFVPALGIPKRMENIRFTRESQPGKERGTFHLRRKATMPAGPPVVVEGVLYAAKSL